MRGRKKKYKIGDEFETNRCGKVVIIDDPIGGYVIRFLNTGTIIDKIKSRRLELGTIHDPSLQRLPSAYKHGFTGVVLKEYEGILIRCNYNALSEDRKKHYPTYEGCYLHEDFNTIGKYATWRADQKFANSKDYLGNKYQIDKDILIPGNSCYGPDCCVFVPQQINGFFSFIMGGNTGMPIGVSFVRKSGKYMAAMRAWPNRDKYEYPFDTQEEAFSAYCGMKREQALFLADYFQGQVDESVISALHNFSVEKYVIGYNKRFE